MKPNYTEIATVVYLLKDGKICLARKKQRIHTKDGKELENSKNIWNGYGGKANIDETVRDTAIRELQEESGVIALSGDLIPHALFNFFWPDNVGETPNMFVYFFFLKIWKGEPKETREMGEPIFFDFENIPYQEMMPNDKVFLPKLLSGEKLVADIFLGEKDENDLPIFKFKNKDLLV